MRPSDIPNCGKRVPRPRAYELACVEINLAMDGHLLSHEALSGQIETSALT